MNTEFNSLLLFSVYDRVAGSFYEPFCVLKKELAIRRFNFLMQSSPMVAKDCDLFAVGTFCIDTGIVSSFDKPDFICRYEVKSSE